MEKVLEFFKKLMESEDFGRNIDKAKFIFKVIALVLMGVFFIFEICQ